MSSSVNYVSLSAYLRTYNHFFMVQTLNRSRNTDRAAQMAQTVADLMTRGKSAATSTAFATLTNPATSTASSKPITYDDVIARGKALASGIGSIINLFA